MLIKQETKVECSLLIKDTKLIMKEASKFQLTYSLTKNFEIFLIGAPRVQIYEVLTHISGVNSVILFNSVNTRSVQLEVWKRKKHLRPSVFISGHSGND